MDIAAILSEAPGWLDQLDAIANAAELAAHMDFPKSFVFLWSARAKFSPEKAAYDPNWQEWHDAIEELVDHLLANVDDVLLWEILPLLGMTTEKALKRILLVRWHVGNDAAALQALKTFAVLDQALKDAPKATVTSGTATGGTPSAPGQQLVLSAAQQQELHAYGHAPRRPKP